MEHEKEGRNEKKKNRADEFSSIKKPIYKKLFFIKM